MTGGGAIDLRKTLWAGPVAVAAVMLAVLAVQGSALALLGGSANASAREARQVDTLLRSQEPAVFTTVLVAISVLVFVAVAREALNPTRTYRRIAFVALLLSFIPDLAAALTRAAPWRVAIVWMLMHVAAWAVSVEVLIRLTARER
jgi:hypothetical protein